MRLDEMWIFVSVVALSMPSGGAKSVATLITSIEDTEGRSHSATQNSAAVRSVPNSLAKTNWNEKKSRNVCRCLTPNAGTAQHNGYTCWPEDHRSRGPNGKYTSAWCAADEVCFSKGAFINGDWMNGCRRPAELLENTHGAVTPPQSPAGDGKWDGDSIIGEDYSAEGEIVPCEFHSWTAKNDMLEANLLAGGHAPVMCLHSYKDAISDYVKKAGRWSDCDSLATLWQRNSSHGGPAVYLEIGANIGTCLLPMIARPDVVSGIAFEPNPKNLFYLTSSILANKAVNKDITRKAVVYPFALGEANNKQPMYMQTGNHGNTVLGKPTEADRQEGVISVRTLDSIIESMSPKPRIHVMKIDAQGYEVNILKGASKLFASHAVEAVKFEIATEWLHAQRTTPVEYVNAFIGFGYNIHKDASSTKLPQAELVDKICAADRDKGFVKDFVALRVEPGEQKQQLVSCARTPLRTSGRKLDGRPSLIGFP
jgi:FkbM family methyltransferase